MKPKQIKARGDGGAEEPEPAMILRSTRFTKIHRCCEHGIRLVDTDLDKDLVENMENMTASRGSVNQAGHPARDFEGCSDLASKKI